MVADVDTDLEAGAVVRGPESGEHLEEIIKGIVLAWDDATGAFGTRELGQDLGDVIGHGAILDVSAPKDISDENIEVKAAGNAKTAATFEQRAEKCFVVENEIAGFFVGEEFDQAIGGFDFVAEH